MSYPFCAIVGQDDLKTALLILAVNPAVGGVLVRGDKGSAKSTTARALAELLPARGEGEAAPFVTLPLGATEDRVIGTLDLERALRGEKALQAGLIAEAHEGVLYIDEVNLLADHLVDVLLDVAAMGVNRVQREGLSVEHPAVFALIGTMNPEEGNLRPQFLDRFGLCVDVHAPHDPKERAEIVRRRVRFELDSRAFASAWNDPQEELRQRLRAARALLPSVTVSDGLLETISTLCRDYGVRSLRADLVLHRATRALAALEEREEVTLDDVKRVAPLVLAHRRHQHPLHQQAPEPLDSLLDQLSPPPPAGGSEGPGDASEAPTEGTADKTADEAAEEAAEEEGEARETTYGAANVGPVRKVELHGGQGSLSGRRAVVQHARRGSAVRVEQRDEPTSLAVSATLRSAADRAFVTGSALSVTRHDFHERVREGRAAARVLFVVDASGSVGARARMEAVKGAVLALLSDAYERRDEVGVIAFRGVNAQVLLPFTRDVSTARQALESLPTGGRTPLAHALALADELLGVNRESALLVLLTDGKANVPLPGGGDAWEQVMNAAAALAGVPALVLDTETGFVRSKRAADVARSLGAECLTLEELTAETLALTLRRKL